MKTRSFSRCPTYPDGGLNIKFLPKQEQNTPAKYPPEQTVKNSWSRNHVEQVSGASSFICCKLFKVILNLQDVQMPAFCHV